MAKKVTMRILRVGKFKDSKGNEHEFTGEKLKTIADGFSFSGEEDAIPDIISHDNRSPRVGFVKKVYLGDEGNSLFAESEIHDDFAQAIGEGFYPAVSVRLNSNSTKIQHIAHLGKEKPAIKGLGLPNVEFSEADDAVDFAEMSLELYEQVSGIFMKELRDALWNIQDRQNEVLNAVKSASSVNNFSEPVGADNIRPLSETEETLKKKISELESQIQANKENQASEFAEQLVKDGKILPVTKKVVVRDFMACGSDAEFSEFKAEYENLPVNSVLTGVQKPNTDASSDFSSDSIIKRTKKYQADFKEKNGYDIDFTTASIRAEKGEPV